MNINTYFVTDVVVVGFGSSVVRRGFRNPKFPGSNPATIIRRFFFSFFFLFHIIKLLTKQNNSNTIHNLFFFFFFNRRRVGAWGIISLAEFGSELYCLIVCLAHQ